MEGKVLHFNQQRGIGAILGDDGNHYFVHYSNIEKSGLKILYRGERVDFDVQKVYIPGKNDVAINIVSRDPDGNHKVVILKNPFNLGPINKPEEFAGRKRLIEDGVTSLLNNNNILLTGARGMGKSSLANQFVYIAQGNNYLITKLNIELGNIERLDYGVVSIRAFKNYTINDIAGNIVRGFIKTFDLEDREGIASEINLDDYQTDMKTFTSKLNPKNLIDWFNYDIITIYDLLSFKDGLLVFIDEVENISPETEFANFVKNVTEYFATEGKKINFILSGIPSATTDLFHAHPSFYRLFAPLEVMELSPIESDELIDIYMRNQPKRIDAKAKTYIGKITRGFPVNLQLVGFHSYKMDTDGTITNKDIDMACTEIVKNWKRQEFDNRHESIGYGLPEKILRHTVVKWKGNVRVNELFELMKDEKQKYILDALNSLENQEILYREKKGVYCIRDYLFFLYLKDYYEK